MAINRGKQFEQKLRDDFSKVCGSLIYRIPDQVNGHRTTSQNPCDFFGYVKPLMFMIEAKSINGNTFPITNFIQYERMRSYRGIPGLRRGVVIWFIEHDKVLYVPVITIEKMIKDGKKSVNIRTIANDGYDYVDLPSVKKRVFLDTDYSVLCDLPENW